MRDDLIRELFAGLRHKGPGSPEATRRALSMLPRLETDGRILELGCGGGAATIELARQTAANITAVDLEPAFVAEVKALAEREGLTHRITPLVADMRNLLLARASFDVVWSEGAIYPIGFAPGLSLWRRWLRPKGFVAVTELTWLTESPSEESASFWGEEYPAMTTIERNLELLREAGFRPIGHFVLPHECWDEHYYGPLEQRLGDLLPRHPGEDGFAYLAEEIQAEIDLWRRRGDEYGYVFYLGQFC